jgi:hypothetical protein
MSDATSPSGRWISMMKEAAGMCASPTRRRRSRPTSRACPDVATSSSWRRRACTTGGSFCQEMSGNIFLLSPRHSGRPHTLSRSSCGNAGRDGGQGGGAGASGGGLTWPVARGGSVQGFPCRHYGRCVLDEHIAWRPMPSGLTAPTRQRVSGRSGTDGNGNRRRGAGNRATYNKLRGLASCPASRLLFPAAKSVL